MDYERQFCPRCDSYRGYVCAEHRKPSYENLESEIASLKQRNDGLLEQLSQQTKSFCSHCGALFPKGKEGVRQFRQHIADCNAHPLHPLANEVAKLRAAVTAIARGDPFHEHPDDVDLAPGDVVMDYAAYRFAAKKLLEAKGW